MRTAELLYNTHINSPPAPMIATKLSYLILRWKFNEYHSKSFNQSGCINDFNIDLKNSLELI